jgi:hypothetical protein
MLVIAPLRVARQTWPDEIAKWDQFSHLKFAVLHGPRKDDLLKSASADVYLMNPEGVPWLCHKYFGKPLPFDILVIDELTKFKNPRSERSKRLRPHLHNGPRYRWGLTGSLAGDGNYEDVFGQQLMLDDGAALGKYITHYRDKYFSPGFDGFSYKLNRGAEQAILAKLAPYWFYMDPKDYTELPKIVDNPVSIIMQPAEMAHYVKMRDKYITSLPGGVVTAANAAGVYSKLAQMANGAVYDDDRAVHKLHDAKLDALEDLVEELNGEPLLIGYEFQHDLARMKERWPNLAHFGGGAAPTQEKEWTKLWNAGKLPMLAGHPASMGHGLNLQGSSAANVCWFSIPWSFELYDQFLRRVWRDGNEAEQIFNHMLIVKGTIDEDKLASRDLKGFTSENLIASLNEQILREARTAPGGVPVLESDEMVQRLSRPNEAPAAPAQPAGWGAPPAPATNGSAPVQPAGWGAPQTNGEQRERIQQTIAPTPAEQVSSAFGGGAQQQAAAIQGGDYGPVAGPAPVQPAGWGAPAAPAAPAAPTRHRRTKAEIEADEAAKHASLRAEINAPAAPQAPPPAPARNPDAAVAAVLAARVELLKIAFADVNMPLDEGLSLADDLWKWLNKI